MIIAVTYENGNVFQHFGHTENFKLYEVEGGEVKSTCEMDPNGVGHEALATLLAETDVDVLICGGMGQGAKDALDAAGIEVYAGASGSADEAVAAYLRGELEDTGVNCDHHDHEHSHDHPHSHEQDQACGAGCGGCGTDASGCGGCAGCGEPQYVFEGKNVGKVVKVHYEGTLDNGEQFDSSYNREPLEYTCGIGRMLIGFDYAVANLEPGEVTEVHLEPEEAYGMHEDDLVITMDRDSLPESEELFEGDLVMLQDEMGRPFDAMVAAVDEKSVSFDLNHPMAGKALNFKIELLEVR